jgi:hypothetical protein
MPTVENHIVIERPQEDVWEYLTDPTNARVWQSNVIEFDGEVSGHGTPQVGDKGWGVVKIAGRKIETRTETVEVAPGEMMALRSVDAPFHMLVRYELGSAAQSTRLPVRFETSRFGGSGSSRTRSSRR